MFCIHHARAFCKICYASTITNRPQPKSPSLRVANISNTISLFSLKGAYFLCAFNLKAQTRIFIFLPMLVEWKVLVPLLNLLSLYYSPTIWHCFARKSWKQILFHFSTMPFYLHPLLLLLQLVPLLLLPLTKWLDLHLRKN